MTHRTLLLSTTLAGFAMACAPTPAAAEVPAVVADMPVVHSLAAQVMGDLGTPTLLLDRGADPHNFQLRPTQAQALSGAGAVFWVGGALSPWMARAIDGIGLQGPAVALLEVEGVTLRDFSHGDGHDDHAEDHDAAAQDHGDAAHDDHAHDDHAQDDHAHDDHGHDDHGHDDHAHDDHAHDDHAHDHGGVDPHAWLDPENATLWLEAMAAQLGTLDPANAATYAANARTAAAGITALEAELRDILAPVGDAPIVVFHDAYGYFADHFDVNVVGSIALGDSAPPGAARLSALRAMLRDGGVVCIFPEVNHSPRYAEMLLEGSGSRLGGLLDPAGVAMDPGPALYGDMMRSLARTIADCVTRG